MPLGKCEGCRQAIDDPESVARGSHVEQVTLGDGQTIPVMCGPVIPWPTTWRYLIAGQYSAGPIGGWFSRVEDLPEEIRTRESYQAVTETIAESITIRDPQGGLPLKVKVGVAIVTLQLIAVE